GPAVRQREGPRVPGQDVGLEPDPQIGGGLADAGEVLTEGVPLAEVPGVGGAESLAKGRPHAVGADGIGGTDGTDPVDVEHDATVVQAGPHQGVAVMDLGACGP